VLSSALVAVFAFAAGWTVGYSSAPRAQPTIDEMQFLEVAQLDRHLPDCVMTGPQIMALMKRGTLETWRELEPETKLWGSRFVAAQRFPERQRSFHALRARAYIETLDGIVLRGLSNDQTGIAEQMAGLDDVALWYEKVGHRMLPDAQKKNSPAQPEKTGP
jgi:hypothetical protein